MLITYNFLKSKWIELIFCVLIQKSEIFFEKGLTKEKTGDIIYNVDYKKHCLGVAQLVARYLGVVEAVGSSPVTQTNM